MPCSRHLGRALGQALELEPQCRPDLQRQGELELELELEPVPVPCSRGSRHLGRALGQALELELEPVLELAAAV